MRHFRKYGGFWICGFLWVCILGIFVYSHQAEGLSSWRREGLKAQLDQLRADHDQLRADHDALVLVVNVTSSAAAFRWSIRWRGILR